MGIPWFPGGWVRRTSYPTVTIYNHLDVQPAQEPEWRQAPFAFRMKNGIYRGRGATDDKGPALTAMLALTMPSNRAGRSTSDSCGNSKKRSGAPILLPDLETAVRFHDRIPWWCRIDLDCQGPACGTVWLRGLLGARLICARGRRRAFGCHRRGGPQPAGRVDGSGEHLCTCKDREGKNSWFLRRCG